MREAELSAKQKGKFRVTIADSTHADLAVPNLLDQAFASRPNEKWLNDILYISESNFTFSELWRGKVTLTRPNRSQRELSSCRPAKEHKACPPMTTPKYVSITFLFLAILGCSMSLALPWFKYETIWSPPRQSLIWSEWQNEITSTYVPLKLFQFGPDLYPPLALNSDGPSGCYLTGRCGTCTTPDFPHRLHLAKLPNFQLFFIYFMRLLGLALATLNLSLGGLGLGRWMLHFKLPEWPWYTYLAVLTALSLALASGSLLILLFLGPIVGDIYFREQLPGWTTCQTTPPVMECLRLSADRTPLASGSVEWTSGTILPGGPILMGLAFMLTMIAVRLWLGGQQAKSQGNDKTNQQILR